MKRTMSMFGALLAALTLSLPGWGHPSSDADQQWARLVQMDETISALVAAQEGRPYWERADHEAWRRARGEYTRLVREFILSHPDDSRRDTAVTGLFEHLASIPNMGPEAFITLKRALPDLSDIQRDRLDRQIVTLRIQEINQLYGTNPTRAADMELRLLDELIALGAPGDRRPLSILGGYLRRLSTVDVVRAEATARAYVTSPHAAVREMAETWLASLTELAQPLDLAFTAIDGREVDLAKLRGKVVVVNFTGVTWCAPCRVAEVELNELLGKYGDHGLEVVAITHETGGQKRDRVRQLIESRGLPWPHFFDGLGRESPLIQRFNIGAVPTKFVLDRTGRMSAFNPRGERLEEEIRQALGLKGATVATR